MLQLFQVLSCVRVSISAEQITIAVGRSESMIAMWYFIVATVHRQRAIPTAPV